MRHFTCANAIRLFFRRHYPISSVTFSSLDPQDQRSVGVSSKLNVVAPLLLITVSLVLVVVHLCIFLDFEYLSYFACLHAFVFCKG